MLASTYVNRVLCTSADINTAHTAAHALARRLLRTRVPSASWRRTVYVYVYSNSIPFATGGSAASLRRPHYTTALTNIVHATHDRCRGRGCRPLHYSNSNLESWSPRRVGGWKDARRNPLRRRPPTQPDFSDDEDGGTADGKGLREGDEDGGKGWKKKETGIKQGERGK